MARIRCRLPALSHASLAPAGLGIAASTQARVVVVAQSGSAAMSSETPMPSARSPLLAVTPRGRLEPEVLHAWLRSSSAQLEELEYKKEATGLIVLG